MSTSDPDLWAESLLNHRVGMFDDYGNLVLSIGFAQQQKPQEMHGLHSWREEPTQDAPTYLASHKIGNKLSKLQKIAEVASSEPILRSLRSFCLRNMP